MRRRFGRRRWGSGGNGDDGGSRNLDAGQELARILKLGLVPADALEPADIARAVMYAVSQPPHVDINEILVRPTAQAG